MKNRIKKLKFDPTPGSVRRLKSQIYETVLSQQLTMEGSFVSRNVIPLTSRQGISQEMIEVVRKAAYISRVAIVWRITLYKGTPIRGMEVIGYPYFIENFIKVYNLISAFMRKTRKAFRQKAIARYSYELSTKLSTKNHWNSYISKRESAHAKAVIIILDSFRTLYPKRFALHKALFEYTNSLYPGIKKSKSFVSGKFAIPGDILCF